MLFKIKEYYVNKCVSLVAREMIQIQCTRADVDARPMHEPKISTLDGHQHQRKCSGFESFLEQDDLRMY